MCVCDLQQQVSRLTVKPLDALYTDNEGENNDIALTDEASGLGILKYGK